MFILSLSLLQGSKTGSFPCIQYQCLPLYTEAGICISPSTVFRRRRVPCSVGQYFLPRPVYINDKANSRMHVGRPSGRDDCIRQVCRPGSYWLANTCVKAGGNDTTTKYEISQIIIYIFFLFCFTKGKMFILTRKSVKKKKWKPSSS